MKYLEIKSLYKYMFWNNFIKISIENGKFWFFFLIRFNDLIDCGIFLSILGNMLLFVDFIIEGFLEIGKVVGVVIKNLLYSRLIIESV